MSDGPVTLLITPIERDNMLTVEKIEASLDSDCTCVEFDEDENESQASECWGCWDDNLSWVTESVIYPWMEANNYHDNTPIKIVSPNLGWMRQAAFKDTYAKDVINDLTINGEFTLYFTLEGATLTCVRSSHDEMGAKFTFEARPEEEDYR
jgi:hypothetical protein